MLSSFARETRSICDRDSDQMGKPAQTGKRGPSVGPWQVLDITTSLKPDNLWALQGS